VEDVQLSDGEIAELNEAVTRSHSRSKELRAALVKLPPASGAGRSGAGGRGRLRRHAMAVQLNEDNKGR
jgi:hypothetical protein